MSVRYGKRIVINGNNANLANLKREEIIEIVDYDPFKKIVLSIGQIEPNIETPVHCIIHRAREDVNAIIELNSEKLSKNLPSTEKEYPPGSLELAKEILGVLRTHKGIIIKNKGVLFVGTSLKEAEDLVINHLRSLNED
jgi:ribulose-5-phosphate 4-epimerase/fuculose-1-phosphate aldolase